MLKIDSVVVCAGKRTREAVRGVISIGSAEDVDIRFNPALTSGVKPLHACLKRASTGLQVCRLTPGAEVFQNGRVLKDRAIIKGPSVLQIGINGPVLHIEFEETPADGSWGYVKKLLGRGGLFMVKIVIEKTVGGAASSLIALFGVFFDSSEE